MNKNNNIVTIIRKVDGIIIPSGKIITLYPGYQLLIHQSKGGIFTLIRNSILIKLRFHDVDAIGKKKILLPVNTLNIFSIKLIWDQLKTCYDPEIPINIVDLGLIYSVKIHDFNVIINMTLTNMWCGMGPFLKEDIKEKIAMINKVKIITINLVFEPKWNVNLISVAGKLELGLL